MNLTHISTPRRLAFGANGIKIQMEDQAMERFIQLNLRNDSAKAEAVTSSKPELKLPAAIGKPTNMMANKFAHKPARTFARSNSGIFTK